MPLPGTPEWYERKRMVLSAEAQQPERLWYLSFGSTTGWLGGIFTMASGFLTAVAKTKRLGINPGGEVKGSVFSAPPDFPSELLDKLLTKADMDEHFGGMERF